MKRDPIIVSFLELKDLMREAPEAIDPERFAHGKSLMEVEMDGSVNFSDPALQAGYEKLFMYAIMDVSSGAQIMEGRMLTLFRTQNGVSISEDIRGSAAKGPIVLRLGLKPEKIAAMKDEARRAGEVTAQQQKGLPEEATNSLMYFLAALWSSLMR